MVSGGMWQPGQPNSDTEHCVSYYEIATYTHKWFDRPCSKSIKSICQVICKSDTVESQVLMSVTN